MHKYGHMLVRKLLARERFDPLFRRAPVVAQFSSLGSLTSAWLNEFRESLAAGSCRSPDAQSSAGVLHELCTCSCHASGIEAIAHDCT
jgi:tyrosyl-DNA phosphodiesterase-1